MRRCNFPLDQTSDQDWPLGSETRIQRLKLITQLHLVPSSRKFGVILPLCHWIRGVSRDNFNFNRPLT
jgi:hypothetical protein